MCAWVSKSDGVDGRLYAPTHLGEGAYTLGRGSLVVRWLKTKKERDSLWLLLCLDKKRENCSTCYRRRGRELSLLVVMYREVGGHFPRRAHYLEEEELGAHMPLGFTCTGEEPRIASGERDG